jgi:WD40 repeat protein
MFRWLLFCVVLCGGAFALVQYGVPELINRGLLHGDADEDTGPAEEAVTAAAPAGAPQVEQPKVIVIKTSQAAERGVPLAIPEARFFPVDRQEVPSEREGQLAVIGTEVKPGETVPPDKRLTATVGLLAIEIGPKEEVPADQQFSFPGITKGGQVVKFRRWKDGDPIPPERKMVVAREVKDFRRLEVGDEVKAGQLVTLVDPLIALNEAAIKNSQVDAAESEMRASTHTRQEYERRVLAMESSRRAVKGSVSDDDYEAGRLQAERYRQEEIAKNAAIIKSQQELLQAITVLKKHEVRAAIDGVVRAIYKNRGDAVKNVDAIMQIQNPQRLRVEGQMDVQDARRVRLGNTVIVEPSQPESPRLVLRGHLQAVTCVAVARGPKPVIVSGSEDRTLRGWDAIDGHQLWQLPYRVAVRAVACAPAGTKHDLALVGWADGSARLINLNDLNEAPRELAERHRGAVSCVAFSPNGELCATGGDDRSVCLWETETGKLLHRVTQAHRAEVTCVQFTATEQLVTAGRDNSLAVWDLTSGKTLSAGTVFDRRTGDVAQLGVSPDGKRVLFDQGRELRILSLADRQMEGVLQNASRSANFTTMALFSPDGKTILTNAAAEGRLQLWRTPSLAQPRSAELRQLYWASGPATCGAFAPDSSFAVTGTQDNRVLVWPMPAREEIERKLTGRVTLVEQSHETASPQVRVWAELENPGWLLPGGTATMVILPETR